ncbi:MAG: VWA domain-containing protein [Acidimicrobiales bacterium]
MSAHLPFSSVVGQEDAKLALLLAAVEPRLGGVLLRGDKGSAKTTLARGLAALLPAGAPFVELPLGASEDRVVGALDVAALLGSRTYAFRPGLLAAAHGGVLYVDEVNLLPDHLVDVLLDVAVSGVNRVERDGFSESHPARFVLVGSMNPEEGELRPQLLDRFGLAVDVRAPEEPALRAEIVRRQLAFESSEPPDPSADGGIRESLASARPVPCADAVVMAAAQLAVAVGAQGLRADLALCRAAGALAGLDGAPKAGPEHLRRVAPLVLGHRRRRDPFEAPGIASEELSSALDQVLGSGTTTHGAGSEHGVALPHSSEPGSSARSRQDQPQGPERHGQPGGQPAPLEAPAQTREVAVDARRLSLPRSPMVLKESRAKAGKGTVVEDGSRGRQVGHAPFGDPGHRVDGAATAVAHVVRAVRENRSLGDGGSLAPADLQAVVAAGPRATLVIVAVDASGSIAGRKRLDAARSAVISLLGDAYRRRDRVAMVAFRGESAEVVLRPTGSVEVARARLAALRTGGRTPLAAGLKEVTSLVREAQRTGGPRPVVVLVTDGRATAGGDDPLRSAGSAAEELAATGVACLVVDAETGPARLGLARSLATTLGADYVLLEAIEQGGEATALAGTIRAHVLSAGEG